jgi:hypothetical protein
LLPDKASHLIPSLRTAQIFPALQLINWSLDKEINASGSLTRSPPLSLAVPSLTLFLSTKFSYYFAVCVSVLFSVQVTQEFGIFWTSVFLDTQLSHKMGLTQNPKQLVLGKWGG